MINSVYKIVELVGTSPDSWEEAARSAVKKANKSIDDLRIAQVKMLDIKIGEGDILLYRARVQISFKYINRYIGPEVKIIEGPPT